MSKMSKKWQVLIVNKIIFLGLAYQQIKGGIILSNKVKAMMLITISVIAICVTAVVIILLEPCQYCGDKFCGERCIVFYDNGGNNQDNDKLKPESQKTNQKTTRLAQTERADMSYLDSLVFIGDSRTIGLQANASLKDENVFAEDGLNHEVAMTKKVAKIQEFKSVTIAEAIKILVPDIMVVNFGINGIAWMNPSTFMEGYEKFIDELITNSPTSIIIIESITPVAMLYENRTDGVTNEKIDEVNALLYQLAKDKGLYYMAVDEVLKNEYNDLEDSLHTGDGIHYNKAAYEIIIDYILTHPLYKVK